MKPDFSKFDMKDKADKLTMAGVLTEFWNLMPMGTDHTREQ